MAKTHAISFGVLTVSDTCYDGTKQDVAGPELCKLIDSNFPQSEVVFQEIVPDSREKIEDKLILWSIEECNVILTTGGTGCSPRDVTPEATKSIIEKEVPGISQYMLQKSLAFTDKAVLSRAVCGIRRKSLIINLPGSTKGATECFRFVMSSIPHAVALICNDFERISEDHRSIQGGSRDVSPSKVVLPGLASRDRHSPFEMKTVDEALDVVLHECCPTSETEEIRVENSLNRVLAEDIHASDPLPPFRASMKDGYAVRAKAGSGMRKVVHGCRAAGDQPVGLPLNYDEAVRISTGAPIPENADAVIQVEDTRVAEVSSNGNDEVKINLLVDPIVGQDIREIGSDVQANSKVLNKQESISPGHVGVLAALGRTKVKVFRRPSIGVLSTGNELKSHRDTLEPGQIRDSNKLAILNFLKQHNFNAQDCGISKDNPNAVKNALAKAFISNDIVISTGGVSMGEFDLIKKVLVQDFEALIHFGRVNMKPGKPTTFATLQFRNRRKLVFGLPGNPASACVTCILFVLPCLKKMERRLDFRFATVKAFLDAPTENRDERPSYLRVTVRYSNGSFIATSTGNQTSSRINSMVGANGLLTVPGNFKNYTNLDTFETIIIGDLPSR